MKYIIYIILGLVAINIAVDVINSQKEYPTPINKTETIYVTQTQPIESTHTMIIKHRKPTLGECILAPVDLVVGVCNGVIQGIGYGAAYVADTCTIHRLYPEDDHCVHCDLHIDRYHKCKYKKIN